MHFFCLGCGLSQPKPRRRCSKAITGHFTHAVIIFDLSHLFRVDIMRRFLVPVVGDGVAQQREARLAAVAADHKLPWPPEHVTPKRGRPTFDAAWVRAVQRRLPGKRPGWWQLGMDVDKKPLKPEEVQAVTPCAEQVDVATTSCAVEKARTKVHICPVLKDWFLDFAGDNRARIKWSMAHSLRVARRLCPLLEAQLCADVFETQATAVAHTIPFTRLSEVVEEASSQLCMESRMYPLVYVSQILCSTFLPLQFTNQMVQTT